MNITIIQHDPYVIPGFYLAWAKQHDYHVEVIKCWEKLPSIEMVKDTDLLAVLGGPQNPHTTLAECPYFDVQREQTVIKYCIDHHKIVVGTCLGAQLIGESLGFPYEHSPQKEIGMFPITINDDGKQDDVLEDFRPEEELCVWHNDMPGIGDESVILASSVGCPRQIVRYNPLTYGLQCHMEFTNDSIKSMTVHDDTVKDAIQNSDQYQFVESAAELATIDCSRSHGLLASLLDHLVLRYDRF